MQVQQQQQQRPGCLWGTCQLLPTAHCQREMAYAAACLQNQASWRGPCGLVGGLDCEYEDDGCMGWDGCRRGAEAKGASGRSHSERFPPACHAFRLTLPLTFVSRPQTEPISPAKRPRQC